MYASKLATPILLTTFNRPDITRQVFAEIKKARPAKLYIAADGPRPDKLDDKRLCEETRTIVNDIDWDCQLHTLFRDKNLGCMKGMVSAIDWFFSEVEEGIVLEDDSLPHQDFFKFCELMLGRYRNDPQVFMIAGTNFSRDHIEVDTSYFFTHYYALWGWAGWKRSWKHYNISMEDFDRTKVNELVKRTYNNRKITSYYNRVWDLYEVRHLDSWDMQLVYRYTLLKGLCIMPRTNLVSNIGIVGAHTSKKYDIQFLPTFSFDEKSIIHPNTIEVDPKLDTKIFLHIIKASEPPLFGRFKRSVKNTMIKFFKRRPKPRS